MESSLPLALNITQKILSKYSSLSSNHCFYSDHRDESCERDRGRTDHRDTRNKNGDRDRIDRSERDRSDRDRDRERSERERGSERDRDRSKSTRENENITTSSRSAAASSSGPTTFAIGASSSSSAAGGLKDKATIDKLRRERLELVKRLTQSKFLFDPTQIKSN